MIKEFIYANVENTFYAFLTLYVTISILASIVYKLGFARRLPILKSLVVYLILWFGCIFLTLLGTGLPMADGLVLAVLLLIIVRIRTKGADPDSFRSPPAAK